MNSWPDGRKENKDLNCEKIKIEIHRATWKKKKDNGSYSLKCPSNYNEALLKSYITCKMCKKAPRHW